ncbi:neurotrimin-like [Orussus abietinus]|uniref:neurotrimin-like n=1 Tax=Orussus abietinus TaxID=222816 RepID=UPI000C7160BD|nr:neurotrimin-like [Orussus abietinus]
MRTLLIPLVLVFEVHLYFIESQARHQQDSRTNNLPTSIEAEEDEEVPNGAVEEVLAQKGRNAMLPCKPDNLNAGIVTWVKRRGRQLLTVGTDTHSVNKRFRIEPSTSNWALVILGVKQEDAGLYECQVATHPVQQIFVRLRVIKAYSLIPGAPDLHVKQGSSLRLECHLMSATESPIYVFWYHEERMINYEEPGVKVELTTNGSILIVENTKPNHEGKYTCNPDNATPASIMVHVIEEEEKPAAMHGGDRRNLSPAILASNFLVSFLAAVSWRIPSFTSLYPT